MTNPLGEDGNMCEDLRHDDGSIVKYEDDDTEVRVRRSNNTGRWTTYIYEKNSKNELEFKRIGPNCIGDPYCCYFDPKRGGWLNKDDIKWEILEFINAIGIQQVKGRLISKSQGLTPWTINKVVEKLRGEGLLDVYDNNGIEEPYIFNFVQITSEGKKEAS